jgi:hypothetical protein
MPVGITNLKAAQTVVRILERRTEFGAMLSKFGGELIRVFHVDKCIPPEVTMTL